MTKHARPIRALRKHLLHFAMASIAFASPVLLAQTGPSTSASPSPNPAFDVATVKLHPGPVSIRSLIYQPDGFTGSVTLPMLMQYAYDLATENQVSGVPDWAKNEWFDLQAKMSETDFAAIQKQPRAESDPLRRAMMQTLLADRFKLKTHTETRQVPVYELVIAKGGSKLKDSTTDPEPPKLGKGKDGKASSGFRFSKDSSIVQAYSMQSFAGFLSQPVAGVGRPVLDKTGLTSTYNFTINWSVYSASSAAAAGDPDSAPSIFTALSEIGLKLQPATGPLETIVIDHAEPPSEN